MFILHPPHFLPPKGHRARLLALALMVLGPIAFGLLALYLGQDANWDLRNYHFYNAYAFLNNRYEQDLLPSQTPYFYNPLLDVPFYLIATHAPAKVAGFALGFVQGFNFILLFMIAHSTLVVPNARHKVFICAGLSLLGLLGGGGIAQIGTTFGDNITSIGILLSAALIVRHLERLCIDKLPRVFVLALLFGLPSGLMMGLKLPSVIFCVGLCAGFLFIGGSLVRRLTLSFAFGLGVLLGLAITLGHWAYFLETHFGSPLFPYFNQVFKSPLEPAVSARDVQFAPYGWHDYLLMPYLFSLYPHRVGEIDWRDWRLPILYTLSPLTIGLRLFFGRSKAPHDAIAAPYAVRYLVGSFAISYVAWLAMFTIYRYAVTMEMVAPLLIVFAVGMLPLKISTRGLIAAFILAIISASVEPGNWHRRATWTDKFVEAEIPPIADPSKLMILMAGDDPYSHLVPEFSPQISFVRIDSNFVGPDQDKGINKMLHERVDAHRAKGGRFMMLIPTEQEPSAIKASAAYDLKMSSNCQSVTDRLFDDTKLSLCPLTTK